MEYMLSLGRVQEKSAGGEPRLDECTPVLIQKSLCYEVGLVDRAPLIFWYQRSVPFCLHAIPRASHNCPAKLTSRESGASTSEESISSGGAVDQVNTSWDGGVRGRAH
jgi:hypothetical protein